ncbi:MAG: hypothetical protein LBM01_00980 [Christensenellaceae bacterium]|jgi:hypothetical protein|nr:hypothetical protein [Christensenellaceae bacterium]
MNKILQIISSIGLSVATILATHGILPSGVAEVIVGICAVLTGTALTGKDKIAADTITETEKPQAN